MAGFILGRALRGKKEANDLAQEATWVFTACTQMWLTLLTNKI
jgi:hypothetical protein